MNRELGYTSRRVWEALGTQPKTARTLADELDLTISQVNGALRTLVQRPDTPVERINGHRARAPVNWHRGGQPAFDAGAPTEAHA
jgi:hypothetical protein